MHIAIYVKYGWFERKCGPLVFARTRAVFVSDDAYIPYIYMLCCFHDSICNLLLYICICTLCTNFIIKWSEKKDSVITARVCVCALVCWITVDLLANGRVAAMAARQRRRRVVSAPRPSIVHTPRSSALPRRVPKCWCGRAAAVCSGGAVRWWCGDGAVLWWCSKRCREWCRMHFGAHECSLYMQNCVCLCVQKGCTTRVYTRCGSVQSAWWVVWSSL